MNFKYDKCVCQRFLFSPQIYKDTEGCKMIDVNIIDEQNHFYIMPLKWENDGNTTSPHRGDLFLDRGSVFLDRGSVFLHRGDSSLTEEVRSGTEETFSLIEEACFSTEEARSYTEEACSSTEALLK